MNGNDIKTLIDGLAPDGVLTLVPGAIPNAPRIDALVTQSFGAKLTATLGAATVGNTSVTYSAASLASATFLFFPHAVDLPAALTFTTGSDGALDLAVTATMPAGWTLAASFADVGKISNSALNSMVFKAASIAVASADSPSASVITATVDMAKSATANFVFLLGESCVVSGAAGYVSGGNDVVQPSFNLTSPSLQGPEISNFKLELFLLLRAGPSAVPAADGTTPLVGDVAITTELETPPPGLSVPIEIGVTSSDQTTYTITLDTSGGVPEITSLDQLTPYTFGKSPAAPLTAANTPIGTLSLDYLFATIDTVSWGLSNLQFQVSLGVNWTVMDGLFKLEGLIAQVTVPVVWGGGTTPPPETPPFTLFVAADFIVATAPLEASISYPDVQLALALQSGQVIDIDDFLSTFSPGLKLPGDSSDLAIYQFSAVADVTDSTYSLSSAATGQLTIIPGFTLTELNMAISYGSGAVQSFDFGCDFTIANAPLALAASYAASNWQFEGGTEPGQSINLTDLIADIASIFGVQLPTDLPAIVLAKLDMSYSTATGAFGFEADIAYVNEADPILKAIEGDVEIQYAGTSANTWTGSVAGTIVVGNNAFTIKLDFHQDTVLSVDWEAMGGEVVTIADLCGLVGITPPDIPTDLDLDLVGVQGSYDITKQILALGAKSKTWGATEVVVWYDSTNGWQIYFGLATNTTISLSDLPLVGSEIAKFGQVSLDMVEAMVSVPALTQAGAGMITPLIPSGYPKPPPGGLPDSVALAMDFEVNGKKTEISIGTGSTPAPPPPPPPPPAVAATPAPPPPASKRPTGSTPTTSSDGTKWFAVQQSIGPVSIQKVGVRYSDSKLWALMNASVSIGGLEVGLLGLGAGSPLDSFAPTFTVSGITASLQVGDLAFSGALVGSIDPVNLYGEISLQLGDIALGALAGYATYEGDPSFFLYAVLDAPLGGPSFFFVTGVAAGFGINRQLVVPDVSGVAKFPLVQWAVGIDAPSSSPTGDVGSQVAATMQALSQSGVIAPEIGEYWFAIGVHFTSFELLDTFVLVTVSLGNDFELDILGLSTLSLPPDVDEPLAFAQLALEASFKPSQGLVSIAGQLTTASYVLSKDCHITGGFAFYIWYSGEHAGEFVATLGGYGTQFTAPPYFPVVPRLGLNWKVSNQLTISGSEYFALTASAVMAGGSFSAVWQSGGIRAWFNVQCDFLLVFQPLHYYISASIDLGASFSIDLWFTTIRVNIHIGVGAEVWGPPFAGEIDVDLDIISFTMTFGGGSPGGDTQVPWPDFAAQLLPSGSSAKTQSSSTKSAMLASTATVDTPQDSPPAVLQINSSIGVLNTFDPATGLDWLVDGHTFQCTIVSTIPIKTYEFQSSDIVLAPDAMQPQSNGAPVVPNTDFGVGPAGVDPSAFKSDLTLAITTDEDSQFDAVMVVTGVSKAMWEKRNFDSKGVPQNVDPLNDTTIPEVLTGFTLVPTVPPPDQTPLPIPLENLQYTVDPAIQLLKWSHPVVQTSDAFPADRTVQNTIGTDLAAANRAAIIASINRSGFAVATDVDVSSLADPATSYLLAPAELRYLGEAA